MRGRVPGLIGFCSLVATMGKKILCRRRHHRWSSNERRRFRWASNPYLRTPWKFLPNNEMVREIEKWWTVWITPRRRKPSMIWNRMTSFFGEGNLHRLEVEGFWNSSVYSCFFFLNISSFLLIGLFGQQIGLIVRVRQWPKCDAAQVSKSLLFFCNGTVLFFAQKNRAISKTVEIDAISIDIFLKLTSSLHQFFFEIDAI